MSKFLAAIGSKSGEDNLELGDVSQVPTNDQLKEEIDVLMANPAYLNKDDPTHDNTVKKVMRLRERLHAVA